MNLEISIIIPSQNAEDELISLLEGISKWSAFPSEIIVVDSSYSQPSLSGNLKNFFTQNDIKFDLVSKINLFPGKARNIGIELASCNYIAFLDISTIPSNDWLESTWKILNSSSYDGIWGSTYYEAKSWKHKLIRSVTYGDMPLRTVPGSIIHDSVFKFSGFFIESTRAGEDSDWIKRAELHKFNFSQGLSSLNYVGLMKMTFFSLVRKWYRNYKHAAKLPYLNAHKDLYFYFFGFLIIILAFNWNNLSYDDAIRGWNTQSFAYIPNITKISIIFFALSYVLIRSVLIPLQKGVPFLFLIINMPMMIVLSIILDIVKSIAFFNARFLKI